MTFAGWTLAQMWPLFAAGAVAITGLYLLRMRRRQLEVPFAALWDRVTRESESRRLWRKLRRLLSWLLQLLVLALICVSLGDPRPEVWLRDPVSLAIVVDTSASMSAPAPDEPDTDRLDLARRRAEQEVLALGPADRAVIIGASEEVTVAAPLSNDPAGLVPGLHRLKSHHGEADLGRALALASHVVGERPGPRILVLTDGALDPAGIEALQQCAAGPIPCEMVRVSGPTDNVAITAFAARRYPYARDRIEVLTEVHNLGDTPTKVVLTVEADDAPVGAPRTLRLEPGESKREVLSDLDAARSRFVARLTREDGSDRAFGLPHDDEAYAVVPPLTPLDVVLVTDGNNLFLEAALLVLDDHVRLTGMDPQSAREGQSELSEADVVFFDVGGETLPDTLPDAHTVFFDPWRHESSPSLITKKADVARPFLTEQSKEHPALDHVVFKDVNIARGTTFETIPGDQVLVRSIGDPIGVLREAEHTTVAFGFDPRQSDLPMRMAFPMLVDNLIRYFEQREAGFVASVPVGAHRELALADLGLAPEGVRRVEVTGPQGTSTLPVDKGRFRLRALVPGFYAIEAVDGPLAGASVELAVNQASLHASDLHDQIGERDLPTAADTPPPAAPEPDPLLPQGPLWTLVMLVVAGLVAFEWASYHRRVTV
ncbi:MAG: VWA domain-containing protein [Myxococcota bacterium]